MSQRCCKRAVDRSPLARSRHHRARPGDPDFNGNAQPVPPVIEELAEDHNRE